MFTYYISIFREINLEGRTQNENTLERMTSNCDIFRVKVETKLEVPEKNRRVQHTLSIDTSGGKSVRKHQVRLGYLGSEVMSRGNFRITESEYLVYPL